MNARKLALSAAAGLLTLAAASMARPQDDGGRNLVGQPLVSGTVRSVYWNVAGTSVEGYAREGLKLRAGALVHTLEGPMTGRVYPAWFVLKTADATVVVPREKIIEITFDAPKADPEKDETPARRP